jgi:hypothetical protein
VKRILIDPGRDGGELPHHDTSHHWQGGGVNCERNKSLRREQPRAKG